jgi:hypothetical protein
MSLPVVNRIITTPAINDLSFVGEIDLCNGLAQDLQAALLRDPDVMALSKMQIIRGFNPAAVVDALNAIHEDMISITTSDPNDKSEPASRKKKAFEAAMRYVLAVRSSSTTTSLMAYLNTTDGEKSMLNAIMRWPGGRDIITGRGTDVATTAGVTIRRDDAELLSAAEEYILGSGRARRNAFAVDGGLNTIPKTGRAAHGGLMFGDDLSVESLNGDEYQFTGNEAGRAMMFATAVTNYRLHTRAEQMRDAEWLTEKSVSSDDKVLRTKWYVNLRLTRRVLEVITCSHAQPLIVMARIGAHYFALAKSHGIEKLITGEVFTAIEAAANSVLGIQLDPFWARVATDHGMTSITSTFGEGLPALVVPRGLGVHNVKKWPGVSALPERGKELSMGPNTVENLIRVMGLVAELYGRGGKHEEAYNRAAALFGYKSVGIPMSDDLLNRGFIATDGISLSGAASSLRELRKAHMTNWLAQHGKTVTGKTAVPSVFESKKALGLPASDISLHPYVQIQRTPRLADAMGAGDPDPRAWAALEIMQGGAGYVLTFADIPALYDFFGRRLPSEKEPVTDDFAHLVKWSDVDNTGNLIPRYGSGPAMAIRLVDESERRQPTNTMRITPHLPSMFQLLEQGEAQPWSVARTIMFTISSEVVQLGTSVAAVVAADASDLGLAT